MTTVTHQPRPEAFPFRHVSCKGCGNNLKLVDCSFCGTNNMDHPLLETIAVRQGYRVKHIPDFGGMSSKRVLLFKGVDY